MLSPSTMQKIDSGRIRARICDEIRRSSSGKSCPIAGLGEREERRGEEDGRDVGGMDEGGEKSSCRGRNVRQHEREHGPAE